MRPSTVYRPQSVYGSLRGCGTAWLQLGCASFPAAVPCRVPDRLELASPAAVAKQDRKWAVALWDRRCGQGHYWIRCLLYPVWLASLATVWVSYCFLSTHSTILGLNQNIGLQGCSDIFIIEDNKSKCARSTGCTLYTGPTLCCLLRVLGLQGVTSAGCHTG